MRDELAQHKSSKGQMKLDFAVSKSVKRKLKELQTTKVVTRKSKQPLLDSWIRRVPKGPPKYTEAKRHARTPLLLPLLPLSTREAKRHARTPLLLPLLPLLKYTRSKKARKNPSSSSSSSSSSDYINKKR